MSRILPGHEANAWFRYGGGEIHDGARSFELDIKSLDNDWNATLECYVVKDDGKRVGDFTGLAGELELSICPGCSFMGVATIEKVVFSASVDKIQTRVFKFKGIGPLEPPIGR
jgi:hypothetical protein